MAKVTTSKGKGTAKSSMTPVNCPMSGGKGHMAMTDHMAMMKGMMGGNMPKKGKPKK